MSYPWDKMNVVPLDGLEAWYMTEEGVSANNLCKDYSGHGRDLTCSSSGAPVLTPNILNGESAWYFDGSSNPLDWSGSLTPKHIFVVVSADDVTFATYRGLLSDDSTQTILVSNSFGTAWYDFSVVFASEYRKSDIVYAAANQQAPMGGTFALVEIQIPAGAVMSSVRVGQQTTFTARKWLGYFKEALIYSNVKTKYQRLMIYRYFAMRSRLWSKVSSGLNIFPFPADRIESRERDVEHYLSEPYSGDPKALIRGGFKRAFETQYSLRLEAEYDAAEAFHAQHYPLTHFVQRDYRFNPERDFEVRFASSIKEQGSPVTYRFNYTFDTVEAV